MKLELTPDTRRELRAQAHHLDPVVMIGNDGLTPAVLHEIDVNLMSHGLIKIRVFSGDRDAREVMLRQIADDLEAAAVQHIGKLLVVFRPLPAEEKPKRAAAPKPVARQARRAEPAARRPRGASASTQARDGQAREDDRRRRPPTARPKAGTKSR